MSDFVSGVLKGLGQWPTNYLFRWSPTLKNPFNLTLHEVGKCVADGAVVTPKSSQSTIRRHAGHGGVKGPRKYSLWQFFMVQLRVIK